ncbi:hypothetical protein QWJ07_26160 [Frankia sp. RB7]|nr:hypothetical protein [Frankia sp. RB7]
MNHCLTPTKVAPLAADQAAMLMRGGYLLLRGAVREAWREPLQAGILERLPTDDVSRFSKTRNGPRNDPWII